MLYASWLIPFIQIYKGIIIVTQDNLPAAIGEAQARDQGNYSLSGFRVAAVKTAAILELGPRQVGL